MVDAAGFRALRYDPAIAGEPAATSAPAYDELSRFAYARHRTASPYTVLELMTPSDPGDASEGVTSFAAARATLERWRRTGVLVTDEMPAFYRYEQHWLRHGVPTVQRGLLAAVRVDDPHVLTHEHVHGLRVAERLARLEAVPVDLSPVFAVHDGTPAALTAILEAPPREPPIVAMSDEEGVDHRVWRLRGDDAEARIRGALRGVRVLVADGHHRFATAQALARRCRADGRADDSWQRTLMLLTDAGSPEVRGVHRLVRALPPDPFAHLGDVTRVEAVPDPGDLGHLLAEAARPAFALVAAHAGVLSARLATLDASALRDRLPPGHAPAWYHLETALLEHDVLPRLGVDPATVSYRVDAAGAVAEVRAGAAAGVFLLPPVPLRTVLALAAAGDTLPPKSTSFQPKPRTGLVLRPLAG